MICILRFRESFHNHKTIKVILIVYPFLVLSIGYPKRTAKIQIVFCLSKLLTIQESHL